MKKSLVILVIVLIAAFSFLFVKIKLAGFVVTSINTCVDSDNGRNYGEKGFVQGEYHLFTKEKFYEEDGCQNDKILVEYYCVKDGLHSYKQEIKYRCKDRCEDGRCFGEMEVPEKKSFLGKIKEFFGRMF